MEKIKLSNGQLYDIKTSGITSTDSTLALTIVTDSDLVSVENVVSDKENMRKIQLLSESDEVLRIYSDYVTLTKIEKRKNVVVETKVIEPETEGEEPTTEEIVSDVIIVTLRKENVTESRVSELEKQLTETQLALCEIYESMI